jgi:Tryptophan halogenase
VRIAVIGGGAAGYIAATHLTKHLPEAELLHIHDPRIPTIGVGEGTTPRAPLWLAEVVGLGLPQLAESCGATRKIGVRFDGWGVEGTPFLHRFQPVRLIGLHVDAAALLDVLDRHVHARRIEAHVRALRPLGEGVALELAGGETHVCDYAFDARGFADGGADDRIALDWIPTGRAMLRRLRPGLLQDATRAAARPHGWIFQIPLRDWTSCGYIFNPLLSGDAEVAADFSEFLQGEGIEAWEERGARDFPNFIHRHPLDGRVFRIGNAAGFIEPLEATAIGSAIMQVRAATRWIAAVAGPDEVAAFNAGVTALLCRDSLFIAWHYAAGSRWDMPFWRHAREGMARAARNRTASPHLAAMQRYVEAGHALPGSALAGYDDQERWDREVSPLLRLFEPFGNFSELNFAQVGHGIGWYDGPKQDLGSSPHNPTPARAAPDAAGPRRAPQ